MTFPPPDPDYFRSAHTTADPFGIRYAQQADLDPLVELMLALQDHLEASNPEIWQMGTEARSQLRSQIRSRLAAGNSYTILAENAEHGIVGVIFGRIVTNKRYVPSRTGIVDQVFVKEEHRRAGLAVRLVGALCGCFAEQDVNDLSLRYVVGNEEAAAFWRALGFSPRILTVGATRQSVEAHIRQFSTP